MTMQAADCALIVDVHRSANTYCVFEHHLQIAPGQPPEIILVGMSRLTDIYKLIDGKTNSDWAAIFANGGSVMVRIVATSTDKSEARRAAAVHARSLNPAPRCNIHGFNVRGISRKIMCNNGVEYDSQLAAAEELNLSQSAISRHLRGELAHVGGFRFYYRGTAPTFDAASVARDIPPVEPPQVVQPAPVVQPVAIQAVAPPQGGSIAPPQPVAPVALT